MLLTLAFRCLTFASNESFGNVTCGENFCHDFDSLSLPGTYLVGRKVVLSYDLLIELPSCKDSTANIILTGL